MNFLAETLTTGYVGITDSPAYGQLGSTLYCFHHGYGVNHELWYTTSTNGATWTADTQVIGVQMKYSPSVVMFLSSLLAFHNGSPNAPAGTLHYVKATGSTVTGDTYVYVPQPVYRIANSPSATVFNNLLYVAYQGGGIEGHPEGNGQLILASSTDGETNNWNFKIVPGVTLTGSPSMATFNGKIYIVFCNTALGNGVYVTSSTDTNTWTTPALIPNVQVSGDPKLTATASKLVLVHRHPTNAKLHVVTCNNLGVWSSDQVVNTSDMSQDPGVGVFNGKVIAGLTTSNDAYMHTVLEQ
ncbi:hypothetical protein PPL_00994 [Heterostelium album PN500]|uniref:Exo-alpha-sialidase n=1 Tax=Heterostelium pallidum (strain ATCC 26659 / Pp 5 / PN500) TaxID=670386 RepID=D3AXT7_HETP5|nr:hypothetical protein PPL_00994 [Heterostelium album PN500]EFA85764.1 hypothetical protein PPL_00994 [Heterostelium album PN500]|eukprot:XP_020437870.1 hypothetical protein PPL_00994 [Heterostelium album PN500]